MAFALAWPVPVRALPPPPPREAKKLEPVPNGEELWVRETARAYQPVPVSLVVRAGDRLLVRLRDTEPVLVLQVDTPSGLPWVSGVRPGPDGVVDLRFAQSGTHRVQVVVSGDAARAGRAVAFELGLRLRR